MNSTFFIRKYPLKHLPSLLTLMIYILLFSIPSLLLAHNVSFRGEWNFWGDSWMYEDYGVDQLGHYLTFTSTNSDSDWKYKFDPNSGWGDDREDNDTTVEQGPDWTDTQNGGIGIDIESAISGSLAVPYPYIVGFQGDSTYANYSYFLREITNMQMSGSRYGLTWTPSDEINRMVPDSINRHIFRKIISMTNGNEVQFKFVPNRTWTDPNGLGWSYADPSDNVVGPNYTYGTPYQTGQGGSFANLAFTPDSSSKYIVQFNLSPNGLGPYSTANYPQLTIRKVPLILITEFSISHTTRDWIEIANTGSTSTNIANFYLFIRDANGSRSIGPFANSGTNIILTPGAHLRLYLTNANKASETVTTGDANRNGYFEIWRNSGIADPIQGTDGRIILASSSILNSTNVLDAVAFSDASSSINATTASELHWLVRKGLWAGSFTNSGTDQRKENDCVRDVDVTVTTGNAAVTNSFYRNWSGLDYLDLNDDTDWRTNLSTTYIDSKGCHNSGPTAISAVTIYSDSAMTKSMTNFVSGQTFFIKLTGTDRDSTAPNFTTVNIYVSAGTGDSTGTMQVQLQETGNNTSIYTGSATVKATSPSDYNSKQIYANGSGTIIKIFSIMNQSKEDQLVFANTAPSRPTLQIPSQSSLATNDQPMFYWHYSDPDNDPQALYRLQISTNGLFANYYHTNTTSSEITQYYIPSTMGKGQQYYWRVWTKDSAGNDSGWSTTNNFYVPRKFIDGNPADWLSYSTLTNSFTTNSEEWIWLDKLKDQRDFNAYYNSDIAELRIAADNRFLYFFMKSQNIDDIGLPLLCLNINTNGFSSTTNNWIGDNTSLVIADTNQHGQVNLDISLDGFFINTNKTTPWFEPAFPHSYTYIQTTDGQDFMEARIALSNLKFKPSSLANMNITFSSFQRDNITPCTNPNTCDHTFNLAINDGIDTLTPEYLNSWAAEFSDSDVKSFFNINFNLQGLPTGNQPPTRPVILSPLDLSETVSDPTVIWNRATDPDGEPIKYYHVQITTNLDSEPLPFANLIDNLETTTTNTNFYMNAINFIEGQTYRIRIRALDTHGFSSPWSTTNTFTIGAYRRNVNGLTNDWKGVIGSDVDSWTISSNEFIWRDNRNDQRKDGTIPRSDFDLLQFRVIGDTNFYSTGKGNIFFLFKFDTFTDNNRFNINIAIRTNQTADAGRYNWLGDDADTWVDETKAQPDFNFNLCYDGNNDIYTTPSYDSGLDWGRPHSFKSFIGKNGECRISADSLGIDIRNSPVLTIRLGIGAFNSSLHPNTAEKNADIVGVSDILDFMNPGSGRGYNNSDGAWWDEATDSTSDYWIKIKFTNNGSIVRATAKGMNFPTDEDTLKDNYPVLKIVEVSPLNIGKSNYIKIHCLDDGNHSGGLNLNGFRMMDDTGIIKTIGDATIQSGELINLNMGAGTDETTAGSDGILNLYADVGNSRLTGNDRAALIIPYTNDGVLSVMDTVCWHSNSSGILPIATNIYYANEWWTNIAAGALNYTFLNGSNTYFRRKQVDSVFQDSNCLNDWFVATNKISINKTISEILLNGTASSPIPGSSILYSLTYSNTGNNVLENVIIMDKLPTHTIYQTQYNGTASGWACEWSTNTIPSDQSWSSTDFTPTIPSKEQIKWVRWKKGSVATDEDNRTLFIKVIIK